ncbi:MAG: diacylglycerol/lipid kinase family protein [Candidatus Hodarchaeales archaeon]
MEKFFMIVNPTAGGGRVAKLWPDKVIPLLEEYELKCEYQFTEYPKHAIEIAKDKVDEGYTLICSVGGDGTANEVINGILHANEGGVFGAIPLGSGDDIPTAFGIPEKDLTAAIQCLKEGQNLKFDVGYCEKADRYFAGVASMGFDAEVADRTNKGGKKREGTRNYQIAIIMTLLKFKPYDLRITIEGNNIVEDKIMLLAIGNGKRYGGGMHVCPEATVTDGKFHVSTLSKIGRITLLRIFPKIYDGEHIYHKKVSTYTGSELFVESLGKKCLYQVDGEILGYLPEKFITRPDSLCVRVPNPWVSYTDKWREKLREKGKDIPKSPE